MKSPLNCGLANLKAATDHGLVSNIALNRKIRLLQLVSFWQTDLLLISFLEKPTTKAPLSSVYYNYNEQLVERLSDQFFEDFDFGNMDYYTKVNSLMLHI